MTTENPDEPRPQPTPPASADAEGLRPDGPARPAWARLARGRFAAMLAAGLAHAGLLGLAFPPLGVWPAALLAPVPLLLAALTGPGRPLLTALGVGLGAAPFWALHTRWTAEISAAGFAPLVLYLSLYPPLFVLLGGTVARRLPRAAAAVALPAVWLGVEWFRGRVMFDGFAWYFAGHPLILAADHGGSWLPGPAAASGASGVSGLAVLAATLGTLAAARPGRARAAHGVALGLVLAGWLAAGTALAPPATRPDAGATLRVALVQTNLPQSIRGGWPFDRRLADLQDWLLLTRDAARPDAAGRRPDLIVWPETMFPGLALQPEARAIEAEIGVAWTLPDNTQVPGTLAADLLLGLQRELGVPMIIGATGYDGFSISFTEEGGLRYDAAARHNSAFALRAGAVDPGRYDKLHLTPFGEVMPYISAWPWLERSLLALGAEGMRFDLEPGDAATALPVLGAGPAGRDAAGEAAGVAAATPICFEATAAWVVRRLVAGPDGARTASVIINLTNDGWFGRFDAGRETHLMLARWRCVELATPMARAANTGVSAAVDARGRVIARGVEGDRAGRRVAGVLVADLPLPGPGVTPFARTGDALAWAALAATAALGLWAAAAGLITRTGRRRDA